MHIAATPIQVCTRTKRLPSVLLEERSQAALLEQLGALQRAASLAQLALWLAVLSAAWLVWLGVPWPELGSRAK
jgi:hypothetical protein